jgi:hypothetical protein
VAKRGLNDDDAHVEPFSKILSQSGWAEIAAFARLSGLDRLPPASAGGFVQAFEFLARFERASRSWLQPWPENQG